MGTRQLTIAAVLACGSFVGSAPADASIPVSGDPVRYWQDVMIGSLALPPDLAGHPYAMVDVAMFDAVNQTAGKKYHGYINGLATAGGDTRAAASQAAHDVLVQVNPGGKADYDAALVDSLALVPNSAAKAAGIATGATVAAAVLAKRAGDGYGAPYTYTPSGLPGRWAPTPDEMIPAQFKFLGSTDPWVIASPSSLRPGPPPALDSAGYTAAFNEVKSFGSATSVTRTADQTDAANFIANVSSPFERIALNAAESDGLSSLASARMFAMASVAYADAVTSVFEAKYYYDFWRPVTAIRAADIDGNPDTVADPSWHALVFTPPFPSYSSAATGTAGAVDGVLSGLLGTSYSFCLDGPTTRCWNSLTDATTEFANARIWGGVHWRFDTDASLGIGASVSNIVLDARAFQAVPEPASWALMTVGLSLVGLVVRRRRIVLPPRHQQSSTAADGAAGDRHPLFATC